MASRGYTYESKRMLSLAKYHPYGMTTPVSMKENRHSSGSNRLSARRRGLKKRVQIISPGSTPQQRRQTLLELFADLRRPFEGCVNSLSPCRTMTSPTSGKQARKILRQLPTHLSLLRDALDEAPEVLEHMPLWYLTQVFTSLSEIERILGLEMELLGMRCALTKQRDGTLGVESALSPSPNARRIRRFQAVNAEITLPEAPRDSRICRILIGRLLFSIPQWAEEILEFIQSHKQAIPWCTFDRQSNIDLIMKIGSDLHTCIQLIEKSRAMTSFEGIREIRNMSVLARVAIYAARWRRKAAARKLQREESRRARMEQVEREALASGSPGHALGFRRSPRKLRSPRSQRKREAYSTIIVSHHGGV